MAITVPEYRSGDQALLITPPAPPAPPVVVQFGGHGPVARISGTGNGSVEPFELLGLSDLTPRLDVGDFVEGLLIAGGASVLYGPSNVGKSFVALDLAVHVAAGRAWRNGAHHVEQGAVIYVALEGRNGISNRIQAMRLEGMVQDDIPLYVVHSNVNLLEVSDPYRLVETVKRAAEMASIPVKLVIIDTLSRAIAGGNENASEDMTAAVQAIDLVRKETEAHVMLVHHCGKDESRGSRGHSSLRAAVDTEIELHRPDGETVTTMRVTKQRDLESGQVFPFSLDVVNIGDNERGKMVTSCVVRHEPEEMASVRQKAGRKQSVPDGELLVLLPARSTGEWQKRVEDELGVSRSAFFNYKNRLLKAQKIVSTKEGGWTRNTSPEIPE